MSKAPMAWMPDMRICRLGLLGLMLVAAASSAAAKTVGNLYHAQTIVTGTEEPERTRGFREALAIVVVKLTGDARLAGDPRIAALAAEPHALVQSFAYEDRMKDIPVHDEQGTRERPHFLRVTFSQPAIDAALRRLGIRRWQPDRPVVAVWLGVDTPAGRFVLTDAGPEGYGQRAVITERAQRLGLPIELPETGRRAVGFDDVSIARLAALQAAAPQADAHLVGRLTARGDGYWDIAWSFHAQGASHHWVISRATFDHALGQGLANAAATLSGTGATAPSGGR